MSLEPPPRPDVGFPYGGSPYGAIPEAGVTHDAAGRPLATWRWWEVLAVVILGFFIGTLASVPVFLLFGSTVSSNGASGVGELAAGVVLDVVLLLTLIFWLRRRHPMWKQIIGFPTRAALPKEAAIGAGLGLAVRFAAGIASVALTTLLQQATNTPVHLPEQVSSNLSGGALVVFAIYAVIVAPITEEFVFRGLLYRSIRDRRGVALGAIVSSLAFGLVHFIGGQPWQDVIALQLTMVVTGIGLALIYEWRKNLVSDIAGHAAFNLLAVILIATGTGIVPGLR